MTEEPKKRGRKPYTEEQKAAAAAAREAKKAAGAAETPKAAPKRATSRAGQMTENAKKTFDELSDDEQFAVLMDHSGKLEKLEGVLAKAKAEVKAGKERARAEIGATALHQIKLYQDLQTDEGQARLRVQVNMGVKIARWAGMPVGHMDDIFGEPDRTPVVDKTKADGKRAGLAGESASPPTHLTGELQQAWMTGHAEGQQVHFDKFKEKPADVAKMNAASPPAQSFGSPPPTNWHAEGAKAFVDGKNDTAPSIVPLGKLKDYQQGYANAKHAHEMRTGTTTPDWRQQGVRHREAGGGGAIPSGLSKEAGDAWFLGWREKDAEMRGVEMDERAAS